MTFGSAIFACLVMVSFEAYAGQQDGQRKSSEAKCAFGGGAFAISFTSNGPYDPEGPAPMHATYSESMPARTIGAAVIGGIRVGRHLGFGGELMTERARSSAFTQDEPGMTDYRKLVSRHTSRETMFSAVFRWHSVGRRPSFEPVGGMAVSHATDELTERRGTYWYPIFPPITITAPDSSSSSTRLGFVAGGDALFPVSGSSLSVFGGARLYWIDRSPSDAYSSEVPRAGGRVLLLIGGVRWQ